MKKVLLVAVLLIMAMGLFGNISGTVLTNGGSPVDAELTAYYYNVMIHQWIECDEWDVPNNPETGYYNLEVEGMPPYSSYKVKCKIVGTNTVLYKTVYTQNGGSISNVNFMYTPVAQH